MDYLQAVHGDVLVSQVSVACETRLSLVWSQTLPYARFNFRVFFATKEEGSGTMLGPRS